MTVQIPVYQPYLRGNEKKYVMDCMDSTWISSKGEYIDRFEAGFSELTGVKHAICVSNGSVALHLALHCLGVGKGDEVLVPSFTYVASVNAILMSGATPVFVESDPENWLMDIADAARKLTPRTKAIMPVHLYGFTCDMEKMAQFAKSNGLKIVEDAAEATGVRVNGHHVGRFADVSTFSFFGNKTLTCGEGGMIITNDDDLAENLRITKNQGMSTTRRYWHDRFGVNYRMTNIQAAIGVAQLEQLETISREKKRVYDRYRRNLVDLPLGWQVQNSDEFQSNYWLVSFLLSDEAMREKVMKHLEENGIETRPVFIWAHQLPYLETAGVSFPVAQDIASRGMSVPSYPDLSDEEIDHICAHISASIGGI
ncbi:MAG: DegT/DnrJ/EryC1/StrS family aminotransferase [Devosiaceae bacterium]|nr:DegT/DnrJ/EryC1/StrS family aminotransferase [Devosiaceae bacterium]